MSVNYIPYVAKAIDYIEENLSSPLLLCDIADHTGFSKYHFLRFFQSTLGESAYDYLRRRRLAKAAQDLLETNDRILDIALRYQFGSQEAFTRSFKQVYGLTPGQYRKRQQPLFIEKPRLTRDKLLNLIDGLSLTPRIAKGQEFKVMGLLSCNCIKIPQHELWNQLEHTINEINFKVPPEFVCISRYISLSDLTPNIRVPCLFGVLVDSFNNMSHNMVCMTVPASKYAIFTLDNELLNSQDALNYILGTWLQQSHRQIGGPDVIWHFGHTNPTTDQIKCNIYVPVK